MSIGRLPAHALYLNHPQVSREHAEVVFRSGPDGGGWFISDVGSKHGTRLNGVLLPPSQMYPLRAGDYIEIAPWTLTVHDRSKAARFGATLATLDDAAAVGMTMAPIRAESARELDRERLRLILSCAETIQMAPDQRALADAVLEAAARGTGYSNIALLGPLAADGTLTIIGHMGDIGSGQSRPRVSRTLIQEAARGHPVQLVSHMNPMGDAMSIVQLGIQEAICAPLMVETAVVGFLYLDNRNESPASGSTRDAGAFVSGLGRLASLALANQMRQELERRYARVQGELAAAAEAQQLILPPRQGQCGIIRYSGTCVPGRMLSGDFFDIFELDDGRVAITIGDVAGKGVAASVLMTTAQGFIHGALRQHGDPARAAVDLNRFVQDRGELGKFITLWIGVVDPRTFDLTYVDAGHGYVWMVHLGARPTVLDEAGGPAVGVVPECRYVAAAAKLEPGGFIALVSDGIVEQPGRAKSEGAPDQFGIAAIERWLMAGDRGTEHEVADLLAAVRSHAGTTDLADDATVLLVRRAS